MDKDIVPGCGVGALHARLWLPEGAFRGLACKPKGHIPRYAPRCPSTTLQDFSRAHCPEEPELSQLKASGIFNRWTHSSPDQLTLDQTPNSLERGQGAALPGPLPSHVTHSANEPWVKWLGYIPDGVLNSSTKPSRTLCYTDKVVLS